MNDTDVIEGSSSNDQSAEEDNDSVTSEEIEPERQLPRAMRELADHNKRGLREQPTHGKRQPVKRHFSEEVTDSQ